MGASQEPPLDEIQWRSPPIAQSMGGIHTNTVLPYFSHSPFFDATSNNATLTTQATYNPSMFHLIQTREAFEGRLRTMQGVEFMVMYEPAPNAQQVNGVIGGEDTGVWVIRKQNRRKRQGFEDDITALSSYFVIGENVYMAPSVANVFGSRMLSTVTYLTKFLLTASSLPNFSPSLGYTYLPPANKSPTMASSAQLTQQSREDTPMPDTQSQAKSTKARAASKVVSTSEYQEAQTLAESFALSLRYNNEYMDENPLVGEPGSFILSKSHEQPQMQSQSQSRPPVSVKRSAPPTPQPKVAIPPMTAGNGSKGGERSPITPGTKDKSAKRRKSRALGMTGVSTDKPTPK
ncbi:MAG: hypothetical protein M1830_003696 [Pleopsidium flavum]|nr:MAG: hypothetical protein M1830_003696 [Pleopsidium flavum]